MRKARTYVSGLTAASLTEEGLEKISADLDNFTEKEKVEVLLQLVAEQARLLMKVIGVGVGEDHAAELTAAAQPSPAEIAAMVTGIVEHTSGEIAPPVVESLPSAPSGSRGGFFGGFGGRSARRS